SPPPPNVVKIYCNASSIGKLNVAGFVTVARDNNGVVIDRINAQTNPLMLATVTIESDFAKAIQMMRGSSDFSWDAAAVL
ncbi:hypothetical protein Goklo_008850, partial [Gossypium klotzschianum]|nr:hypothetical protein [Gossypium klotzschianum]